MAKTLLHLGAQRMQLASLRTAMDMGLHVIAVDPDANAPGLELADEAVVMDLGETETILQLARDKKVDGVFTFAADFPMPTLSRVCAELSLPGPSPEATRRSTHKGHMRKALQEAGVPSPRFLAGANDEAMATQVSVMPPPFIIKPADSSGGRGVTCFTSEPTAAEVQEALAKAEQFSRSKQVILEQAIEGPEFSVEALTMNGRTQIIAITDKMTSGPPFFVEIGHSQPTRFDRATQDGLMDITRQTIQALGIDNSPSHTEVVWTKDGPMIIEAAARLGGGYINSHLVPLSTGVDIVGAAIQMAIGVQPKVDPRSSRGAAIRFLMPAPGRIATLAGDSRARMMDGVVGVAVEVQEGDVVHTLSDATARVGYVIATGDDTDQAIDNAEAARDTILIQTEPQAAAQQHRD